MTEKWLETAQVHVNRVGRFLHFAGLRMRDDQVNRVAASLSYTSTLALVPALTLALAILAAFPAFSGVRDRVQTFIIGNFVPDTGMRMDEALTGFLEAAGSLTAIGVAGLAITSILLLVTIESAFNRIFRVPRPRTTVSRFVVYWTVITVTPLLIGLSFSLSGYFAILQNWFGGEEGAVSVLLGDAMPTVLAALAFTLIYVAVPNRRVRLADALIGGAVAALLFALLRWGFASFIAGMPTYKTIYGAVAAVPVFLIWLFLSWIAILAGAVITAALPDWRRAEHERQKGASGKLSLSLDTLACLHEAAAAGRGMAQSDLRQHLDVREAVLVAVLDELRDGGFVAFADDGLWRLGRDLNRTTIADLVHHLGFGVPLVPDIESTSQYAEAVSELLTEAHRMEGDILGRTLADVFNDTGGSESSARPRVVAT